MMVYLGMLFSCLFFSQLSGLDAHLENACTDVYNKAINNYWGVNESASGPGSTLEQTKTIRDGVAKVVKTFNVRSVLDIPCGDFNWMKHVDLDGVVYIGADLVKPMIEENNKRYKDENRTFMQLDVTQDELPHVDLIFCRDLLVHLSVEDIIKAIKNFKRSGAKYVLTTTFVGRNRDVNYQISSIYGWRPIDLQKAPFNFPTPELIINEHCT
ncbi:MAG: class I SAM-dependent methyltransferase, partial [Candidatus Dependentiae bacterium]|nr:class I SAM-dependent methyltransferase [Candidatus Dependentiae bacterium]